MKLKINTVLTIVFAIVILMAGFMRSAAGSNIVLASVDEVESKFNDCLLYTSDAADESLTG